jgi:hypothetical protein
LKEGRKVMNVEIKGGIRKVKKGKVRNRRERRLDLMRCSNKKKGDYIRIFWKDEEVLYGENEEFQYWRGERVLMVLILER